MATCSRRRSIRPTFGYRIATEGMALRVLDHQNVDVEPGLDRTSWSGRKMEPSGRPHACPSHHRVAGEGALLPGGRAAKPKAPQGTEDSPVVVLVRAVPERAESRTDDCRRTHSEHRAGGGAPPRKNNATSGIAAGREAPEDAGGVPAPISSAWTGWVSVCAASGSGCLREKPTIASCSGKRPFVACTRHQAGRPGNWRLSRGTPGNRASCRGQRSAAPGRVQSRLQLLLTTDGNGANPTSSSASQTMLPVCSLVRWPLTRDRGHRGCSRPVSKCP